MCGIAGFVGNGSLWVLKEMAGSLAHRGPDSEDFWQEPPVYLGFRRLAIIDLQGGRQPMTTGDGRFTLVFNGEIYNHRELRQSLEQKGCTFLTDHSDTEALLQAYVTWGPAVLNRLNGMFAFVVYDRESKQLFGARDRFGKKPFYYWHRGPNFAFASELSALLKHPDSPKSISSLALKKYFAYGYIPAPLAVIDGVQKLPAGHSFTLDVRSGEFKIQAYWDYVPEPETMEPVAAADELAERLERAVRCRLISDVPLGVFLSGGIDSSAVAALGRRSAGKLKTFTVGFHDPSFDESRFARRVADLLQTEHFEQVCSLEESRALLPRIIGRLDEPMGDSSLLPTYLLCRFAREHVTVCLAGDGGDELFCGYDPFKALRRAQWYARLMPKPLHFGIMLLARRLPVSHRNLSFDFKLKQTLKGLAFPERMWLPVWMGPLGPQEITELFHEKIAPEELYSEAMAAWDRSRHLDLITRVQQFFIKLYLQDSILTKVDRASMMNSLEARCPFLDPGVVDLARRMPASFKFRQGQTKWILKKALRRLLPHDVLFRKKKGFGVPVGRWFLDGSILQASGQESMQGCFGADYFQQRLREHQARQANHRLYLWNAWLLNAWLGR
ncbi:MAG: asparagine synthase (glutamine-hydrolyzing) [Verrucomicrobia bacterium]|nr:asparagine synthase (glutamine-hydrolyzing) [Verrucomicrobiota bacterium]